MTKAELIRFMEPYSDEIIITNQSGVKLEPRYLMDKDGEGFIILTTDMSFVKNNEALHWPIRFKE